MQSILFIVAGACVLGMLGLAGYLLWQKLQSSDRANALKDQVIANRKLSQAKKAYDKGQFEIAVKIYGELEMYEEAANVAARVNDYARAAQLFKKAGNERRAAHFMEKANQKVEEPEAKVDIDLSKAMNS